jgi:hypothetical protein
MKTNRSTTKVTRTKPVAKHTRATRATASNGRKAQGAPDATEQAGLKELESLLASEPEPGDNGDSDSLNADA